MNTIKKSLADLLGEAYIHAVIEASAALKGKDRDSLEKIAHEKVDFFPEEDMGRMEALVPFVGKQLVKGLEPSLQGAATNAFNAATHIAMSPIGGFGCYRVGEDGKLYLTSKSEHYHTSLGHNFNGYQLIDHARALGIVNPTHNNTRGYITRLFEREVIRTVNGISKGDAALDNILHSKNPTDLNRVINLLTGSLAVEAGVKMMLSRFYKLETVSPAPIYEGRIPVFLIMEDQQGGKAANYHGTTVITQTMRGLWPDYYQKLEDANLYKVVSVKINDLDDFKNKIAKYNTPPYKTAGFLHEIILMNYGGIRLSESYLKGCYHLCDTSDTPKLVDEIQSCMWYEGMYLFRHYGLNPDFVIIGKGFSGGQYASSRIITNGKYDTLNLFGALVTNGQEELASLACLITMAFVEANGTYLNEMGTYYEKGIRNLACRYKNFVRQAEGQAHLSTLSFFDVEKAVAFANMLNSRCIDISVQTYKADCPPTVLTKLPIICTKKIIDYLLLQMEDAFKLLNSK